MLSKNIFTLIEDGGKNIGHSLLRLYYPRKQAAAMPRNDASFAIFTFALQIRSCGKHAVAFVFYR